MDEELEEEFRELFDFDKAKKDVILSNIITDDIIVGEKIDISDDVYKDTCIDTWAYNIPVLDGSKLLIKKLIKNPINSAKLLISRQRSFIDYDVDIEIIKEFENDVLWIYKITEEINDNSSIEILFPSSFLFSYINYFEQLLDFYHLYKIYFIPCSSLLYPISTFMAPYYYLKNYMKLDISFMWYLNIIIELFMTFMRPSGNLKQDIIKFVTFILYVGIYLYNIYQTYEIANFLYVTKDKLHEKMEGLVYFVNHSLNITNHVDKNILDSFFAIEKIYSDLKINNSINLRGCFGGQKTTQTYNKKYLCS